MITRIHIGSRVVIRARDNEFWQFVDGWRGTVTGFHAGLCVFEGPNQDGVRITLIIQPEHLELDADPAPLHFPLLCPPL